MLIDMHGHIGRVVAEREEFMDAANLVAKMDAWGIEKTCVLPLSEHPEGAYLECDTEDIIAACALHPDRLIPFCLIDPRFGNSPGKDFGYLLEEYVSRGCRGLGELLPKLDFNDPRCVNLYWQAGKFGLPVLFDMRVGPYGSGLCDDYGLPKLQDALESCPQTCFIGHGPTFWAEISGEVPEGARSSYPAGPVKPGGAVPRLLRKHVNLMADISAGSGYNALTRDASFGLEFIDEFQDRLIFGTDSCRRSDVNGIYPNVAFMRKLRDEKKLPSPALEKVEWKNCARLCSLTA